jgi:nitrite reductase (NADH) small subunit
VSWHAAGRVDDLPERRGTRLRVGNEDIALWKVEGEVYAIGNFCPHQHFPVLFQGERNGREVTCPMHGHTFSLETGKAVDGYGGRARTYPVRVIDGKVMVECPDPDQ